MAGKEKASGYQGSPVEGTRRVRTDKREMQAAMRTEDDPQTGEGQGEGSSCRVLKTTPRPSVKRFFRDSLRQAEEVIYWIYYRPHFSACLAWELMASSCITLNAPLSLLVNVVWHTLWEIRENRSIDLGFWPFLMHGAVAVESGCEEPFHSIKCFFECHLLQHPSFLSFFPCVSSSAVHSSLSLSERSEARWTDTNEVVCWRLA